MTDVASSGCFSSNNVPNPESSYGFLLFITAIQMENACRNESDELNSTEKILSLKGDKLKTGLSSGTSPCRERIFFLREN